MSDLLNGSLGHAEPNESVPVVDLGPSEPPSTVSPNTARDGSPARRPGDVDPAPTDDGAPLFSTDPLG